jgi:hypothetical protein
LKSSGSPFFVLYWEAQMGKKSFTLILVAATFALAGCAGFSTFCTGPTTFCEGPSRLELDHGTSFELARFNQVWNPEAAKNPQPDIGLEGKSAQKTIERYRKEFEKPSPPPTFVLDIGSISK